MGYGATSWSSSDCFRPTHRALDLFEDALRGRDGVELPVVDLLHEPRILAGKALVHLFLQPVRGPRDDEVSQGGPPPLSEPAVRFEELAVLLYRVFEFLDAFARIAAGHHDGREPRVGVELVSDLQYGTHL